MTPYNYSTPYLMQINNAYFFIFGTRQLNTDRAFLPPAGGLFYSIAYIAFFRLRIIQHVY